MPAEFLRGVPGDLRTVRSWWLVPLSIAAHACAAAAAIVIPLAAGSAAPPVHRVARSYMAVAAVTPPAPLPPAARAPSAARDGTVAPRTAPSDIPPASSLPPVSNAVSPAVASGVGGPGVVSGVDGGVGSAIGTIPLTVIPEPPAAPQPSVRRVGDGIRIPRKVLHVDPVYPEAARNARIHGTVILEAVISERGTVERVKVLRSVPLLDTAAIDAVSRWRYTPTRLNGVAVPVLMTITLTFQLHE